MLRARKERLLKRVREALPPLLEPGERPVVLLQALVNVNLNHVLLAVGAGFVVAFVLWEVSPGGVFDGIWRGAVLGGAFGLAAAIALGVGNRWVVVTDRRLLLLRVRFVSQRPGGLDVADGRISLATIALDDTAWGWRSLRYHRPDGSSTVLRVNRMWHEELPAVAASLGVPAPPAPSQDP